MGKVKHPKKANLYHAEAEHKKLNKPRGRAKVIMSIVIAFTGVAIAFFGMGSNPIALIIGAVAGGVVGLLIGSSMDKLATKEQ